MSIFSHWSGMKGVLTIKRQLDNIAVLGVVGF